MLSKLVALHLYFLCKKTPLLPLTFDLFLTTLPTVEKKWRWCHIWVDKSFEYSLARALLWLFYLKFFVTTSNNSKSWRWCHIWVEKIFEFLPRQSTALAFLFELFFDTPSKNWKKVGGGVTFGLKRFLYLTEPEHCIFQHWKTKKGWTTCKQIFINKLAQPSYELLFMDLMLL